MKHEEVGVDELQVCCEGKKRKRRELNKNECRNERKKN
jgi:hypothetical protein